MKNLQTEVAFVSSLRIYGTAQLALFSEEGTSAQKKLETQTQNFTELQKKIRVQEAKNFPGPPLYTRS